MASLTVKIFIIFYFFFTINLLLFIIIYYYSKRPANKHETPKYSRIVQEKRKVDFRYKEQWSTQKLRKWRVQAESPRITKQKLKITAHKIAIRTQQTALNKFQ